MIETTRASVQRAVLVPVLCGLVGGVFVFGMYVGKQSGVKEQTWQASVADAESVGLPTLVPQTPIDFSPYWRVWSLLEGKFIPFSTSTESAVSAEERLYHSIDGLVASYKDPYTVFMRPQISKDFKIATKGSLEGIGSIIGEREGALLVVHPLPGSPAEKAGLRTNDRIQNIDGKETKGMGVEDAVNLIRGEKGTTVVLTVLREGEESREVPIVRGTIEIPSTAHEVVKRDVPVVASSGPSGDDTPGEPAKVDDDTPPQTEAKDFYVLRLFSFSESAVSAFERELRAFKESGAESLIIDLRGNPGGYMEVAINIAGWFLPDGTVVVREYRGPEKTEIVHRSRGKPLFEENMPKIAIVVDGASASASEILAGALREHGVAKVVGVNTFGKGSVQELIDVTPELSLKVTVARWYTPNGVSISDGGLTPDVLVDTTKGTSTSEVDIPKDPFIERAIAFLSEE